MSFWTEIHWSEGMFLRPHHLQSGQRWTETMVRASLEAARPFAWGFSELKIAAGPLENFTLRLDGCEARLKDGTWVRIPENTEVAPLEFKAALDAAGRGLDVYLGIPSMQEVRPNTVSLTDPDDRNGTPRYEPHQVSRRDENTGANAQVLFVRRMRGRLFAEGEDMTGYEVLRVGRVRRTDRPGALPEMDDIGVGPVLAVQADPGLSAMLKSLADQIEAKDEVLAREADETQMEFTDGVAENMFHLLKLHALNDVRASVKTMLQCPVLHPFDVYMAWSRVIGRLAIFHDDRVPKGIPPYDHDRPGESLDRLRARILALLDAMRPMAYMERAFSRKRDDQGREGLEVELDRKWIDENLEMYVALIAPDMDINEVERHIYSKLDMKLASPSRSPRIHNIAVRGLRLQIKAVPAGTFPRRAGLHYFKVDKTIGSDRIDYWKECEQERGIRLSMREGQMAAMERFKPTLFVSLKTK